MIQSEITRFKNSLVMLIRDDAAFEVREVVINLVNRIMPLGVLHNLETLNHFRDILENVLAENDIDMLFLQVTVDTIWRFASVAPVYSYSNKISWQQNSNHYALTNISYDNLDMEQLYLNMNEQKLADSIAADVIIPNLMMFNFASAEQLFIAVVPLEIAILSVEKFSEMLGAMRDWISENLELN